MANGACLEVRGRTTAPIVYTKVVLLPYKITLLSNLVLTRRENVNVLLPYKITLAEFKVVAFPEHKNVVKSRFLAEEKKILRGSDICSLVTKVRITFIPDKAKLRLRKCIVEHPFGSIKRWSDGSYLLLKGNVKATAELSLSFLAYNMKRAISMVGVNNLIAKMQVM